MTVSKYFLILTVVAALGAFGYFPTSAIAEDAAPSDTEEAQPPSPKSPLRVESFDYEDEGDTPGKLKLAGIALPNNELFLYFDDQPFATVVPDDSGNCSVEGELKLDDGRHSLRANNTIPRRACSRPGR